MATKTVKLLLIENVDSLGIVGDVVNVRVGYARNFLLPRALATEPSDEILASLTQKREQAKKEVSKLRSDREKMIDKMVGIVVTLDRSCNDHGILYGSVSQHDLAHALEDAGFAIKGRDVRLPHAIKRVGEYEVHVKLDSDLETDIKLVVKPDRELINDDDREEMEFDNEGELIEKPKKRERAPAEGDEQKTEAPAEA